MSIEVIEVIEVIEDTDLMRVSSPPLKRLNPVKVIKIVIAHAKRQPLKFCLCKEKGKPPRKKS